MTVILCELPDRIINHVTLVYLQDGLANHLLERVTEGPF